ncbi:hypothetical protein Leryth_015294 [Lithospermum erythrorhizon]|nr:hypothetical protein Leryth_015294 [Lithospermum erythrorhizon]
MLVGCGNAVLSDRNGSRYGCTSVCDQRSIGDCYGINCCQDNTLYDTVYRNFNEYYLNFLNSVTGKNSCASAFLVDYKWYPENASLFSDPSADLVNVSVPLVSGMG